MTGSRGVPMLAAGLALLAVSGCRLVGGAAEEFRGEGGAAPSLAPERIARRHISDRAARGHISFLAADARRGRGSPEGGLERSAAWIAEELYRAGLEPAGENGGFLQYWPRERAGERGSEPTDTTVEREANVVARVPGSNLARAGEYVVLVAHYDHLGVGEPNEAGDSVYNGADDNASGVAALVEVARAFGALPRRPARPVVFLAVSAGERGRLGSAWFARNPTVSLSEAVAVINLDMIGRNHPDSIGVVGHAYSTLGPLIADIASGAPRLRLAVDEDIGDSPGTFEAGDHFAFALRGIPSVQFFSGRHDDYHTPSDEADRIDADKVARVARLVFLTAHRIADGDVEPEWTAAGRAVVRP